jgi:hypothetical protein
MVLEGVLIVQAAGWHESGLQMPFDMAKTLHSRLKLCDYTGMRSWWQKVHHDPVSTVVLLCRHSHTETQGRTGIWQLIATGNIGEAGR